MTPELLGTIGVYVSAVLANISLIGLVALARFWRSRGGWFVFSDLLLVTWMLDLIAAFDIFHPHALWFDWLRVGSFAIGFPLVLTWRLWIIFDLQLRGRILAYRGGRRR